MPDNYEVIYTHPTGATATFVRQGGELDALAKGLDSEQFWVFKQVKSILARNDPGDLAEANRMMAGIGFLPMVHEITPARPAPSVAAMRAEALAGATAAAPAEEYAHAGPHGPQPSYWPLLLAISVAFTLISLMFLQVDWTAPSIPYSIFITLLGLAAVLYCIVGWGTEAFHAEF